MSHQDEGVLTLPCPAEVMEQWHKTSFSGDSAGAWHTSASKDLSFGSSLINGLGGSRGRGATVKRPFYKIGR